MGLIGAAAVGAGPVLSGCGPPQGPYGALQAADANGIQVPAKFRSRVLARSGQVVAGTGSTWHGAPDGGATFPALAGGWTYVSNSELGAGLGGAGVLRFANDGTVTGADRILTGTTRNCAGGPTPWGTWLSCEEYARGQVWECDPLGGSGAVARPALGIMSHEAAAVDPARRHVYLTEDQPDGRLYRFTPTTYPDLGTGSLEVAMVVESHVTWLPVPDPSAAVVPTRQQVPTSTAFNGGEGAWYADDTLWFVTKGDNRVWAFDAASSTLDIVYDVATAANPMLRGVDNIVRAASGDLFVAEDGDDLQLVLLEPNGKVWPFLQVRDQPGSEVTGPAFDPSGKRLYFSSQRGPTGTGSGVTYEVTGPFRA
jgi:sugar lactone lactonase YvrE